MSLVLGERHKLAIAGWLATVAMSLSFYTAVTEKRYVLLGALVGGLVVALGVGLRTLRVPAPLVLLLQVVLVLWSILVGFGSGNWYLVPTGESVSSVLDQVDSGIQVAQAYAAPAPPSSGLTLMLVFFVALMAACVDFLALGLNRVPLAGLPLLALYTVPVAAIPDGVPPLGFLPGAIGYVALLMMAERERLAHWGRLVARGSSQATPEVLDTSGLSTTGRRISAIALTTAVVVPLFVPTFSGSIFDGPGDNGDGGSGNRLSFDDPMVSLANSLRRDAPVDLLNVDSAIRPEYLRMVVLDEPGPNSWRAQPISLEEDSVPADGQLPSSVGLGVPTNPGSMRINLTGAFPRDSSWLPVPYNLGHLDADGSWAYVPRDLTVTATDRASMTSLSSYSVDFADIDPSSAELAVGAPVPADIANAYGQVPDDVPPEVLDTARRVTADAGSSYQKAWDLQSFFRDSQQFEYDLTVGYGYGYQAMRAFLQERRGFCQQFAATMAMMARTVDIPSRIVVGFLKPDHMNDAGEYVLTSHDVHAWPELYFGGVGWVRFEPTPGIGAPLPSYAPRPGTDPTTGPTSPTESTRPTAEPTLPSRSLDPGAVGNGGGQSGSSGPLPDRRWLVLAALLVLAATPMLLRAGVRRVRMTRPVEEGAAAESAWTELRDHVRDLRLPWTGSMTPRARRRTLEPLLGGNEAGLAALGRLSLSVERARYARSPLGDANPAADAREVMAVISRGADWSQRVRALAWPASLVPDLRVGWAWLKDRLRVHKDPRSDEVAEGR